MICACKSEIFTISFKDLCVLAVCYLLVFENDLKTEETWSLHKRLIERLI